MSARLTSDEPSIQLQQWGIAILRVAIGVTFFMHGWQKLFQMGIPGVAGFFGQLGVPTPLAAATLVALVELVGGALLIAGLFTRWVSIPLAIDMLVATLLVHLPGGFFAPNGVELVFVLLAGVVALALAGPGAFALDRLIARPGLSPAGANRRLSVGAASGAD